MKVLVCHTYYRQRSGECAVVEREVDLLRRYGHDVELFAYDNKDAASIGGIALGLRTLYSPSTGRDLKAFVEGKRFDVAHVHNTWIMGSPSLYPSLWKLGLPVVKTVHNYRWLCPVATFFRDGALCHECFERFGGALHAVRHRCFEKDVGKSATAALRLTLARDILRIYERYIDVIIVQNEFVKRFLIRAGFDERRMVTKGNFVEKKAKPIPIRGDTLMFLGRLDAAKGLRVLLDAMEDCDVSLDIYGQGPLSEWVESQVANRFGGVKRVRALGYVPDAVLDKAMAGCRAVVFPSEWYESYPLAIVESMALGKPVIASNLGGVATIVRDGVNGLLFPPGDAKALAGCILRLWSDPGLQSRLEAGARSTYEREMSPRPNYERLMGAYELARATHDSRVKAA